QVEKGQKLTGVTEPTREGYEFAGWKVNDADWTMDEAITADITIVAQWTEKTVTPVKEYWTVTIDLNDGTEPTPKQVEKGQKLTGVAEPTREGYEFTGWKANDADWTMDTAITANITIVAQWTEKQETPPTPEKVKVTFNTNEGSAISDAEVSVGSKVTRPKNPTKEGYIFIGWYTDAELKNEYNFNTEVKTALTLYAKWEVKPVEPQKFTVTFNSREGTHVVSLVNVVYGSTIEKPTDPTRKGYTFVGWYKDAACTNAFDFEEDVVTGNITLYAKWELSEYTVTFGNTSLAQQIVPVGGKATKPNTDPVKANFTFAGWYEDAACTKAWDFNTVLTKSVTIYAKWEEKAPTDQDNTLKFPFSSFHTTAQANLDSSSGKTNKELSTGPFTVEAGVKTEAAILNTQGKSVTFTVNGKISNGFVFTGSGASTGKTVTVTLSQGNTTFGTWDIEYQQSKSIKIDGLASGTYKISTSGSIKVNVFTLNEYNVPVELEVHFNPRNGSDIIDVICNKWNTIEAPTAPTRDGYIFSGWYTEEALQNQFDFSTLLLEEITLYAKWTEKPVDPNLPVFTIEYNSEGGSSVPTKSVNEGNKVSAPDTPVREGYIFDGWFEDEGLAIPHDFTQPVTQNYVLHAKWIEKPLVISFVGVEMEDIYVYRGNTISEPNAPERPNYLFDGWYKDSTFHDVFDFTLPFTKDTVIYIKWVKDPDASDYVEGGVGTVGQKGSVEIIEAAGLTEAAFITFKKVSGASGYSISLKNSSGSIRVLDEKSVYFREVNGNMRADIMGVVPGTYEATVLPLDTTNANPSTANFSVGAYDRSGFAHFNYTDGVGAYNDDGSLKKNAIVLWVTDANKNTIELSYKGVTVKGIGNILNSVGQDTGGGATSNGGTPNTNQGIIRLLAENDIPLVVRFVGCVSNTGLYKQGTFNAASTPKIEGLTIYDTVDHGGTKGDNGHMARMKSGKDITLEGVGEDGVIDGWGFHYMAESSAPDLGKSFEVRNLTFINTPEDAVGMEGVQASANVNSILTASVERCWIHNNEFYGPDISSPAESDKGEGDGSCDFKRGQYFTCSYNYFEGCHKTNLVGSSDSSLQFNLTYHHNLWYMCKARGPLARNANIHMYNNAFIGQTDYAMNTRANSYIFSEYNMFYMCKSPTAVESGAIKSYKDSVASYLSNKGSLATVVTDKSQKVSNNCQFASAGVRYDAFDTDPNLSYIPTDDYVLQTDVTLARKAIASKVGVMKDHPKAMTDITMSDISLLPAGTTVNNITSYPSSLAPGKMNKKVYAFKLDRMAKVTINCNEDAVLCNEAGVAMLEGNGSVVLTPGTYMVQPVNFQPGDAKAVTMGTFKDLTINSIQFEEHNSEELNQQMIAEFEAKVNKIPASITYTDACLTAINAAKESYQNLSPELKTQVSVSYAKVTTAYSNYLAQGVAYVEGLINAIGTVNENSGSAISSARAAYSTLYKLDNSVKVSNLSTLTAAEAAFASYAVDSCIAKIEAIGTVTINSGAAIQAARNEYNALSSTDKAKVTNKQKLFDAEERYQNLAALAEVNTLIEEADLTDLASCAAAREAYLDLTPTQQSLVEDEEKLSNILVAYVKLSIAAIPNTVSVNDTEAIVAADNAYQALTAEQKAQVDNYAKLEAALESLNSVAEERSVWNSSTKQFTETDFTFTNANTGSTSGSSTVQKNQETILVSKFKVTNLSKIDISFTVSDKGTSDITVYYSTDGTNWTQFGSPQTNGSNNKSAEHTITASQNYIEGEVYIKIVGTCTKGSAKILTIESLEIYAYGIIKY
ncbi:MAG: InlB B-repeat-containing protein, partial [Anaeroplasmataceae bacterium]|nr:InlB B-repeat-containing protein [Anaeroplasmataceae bacterium]